MKDRARSFRKSMTKAENRMWYFLQSRRLGGYKFVREHIIDGYIADFVCREKKLVIELDGGQHSEIASIEYDRRRTLFLGRRGYRVLRVWNDEVFKNIEGVLDAVLQLLKYVPSEDPHPTLSRKRERGNSSSCS